METVYQRALLKLSGEALIGSLGYGIDPAVVQGIAQEVAEVVATGIQIAIFLEGLKQPLREWIGQRQIMLV